MTGIYKHTQIGWVVLILLGLGILLSVGAILAIESNTVAIIVLVFLLVCAILFGTLTIEIRNGVLAWRFGPGIIQKSVRIGEIVSATAVKNSWLCGWGIRMTLRGWLYNVSGLEAVEIELKNGRRFRLGTDEPQVLAQAIMAAKGGS